MTMYNSKKEKIVYEGSLSRMPKKTKAYYTNKGYKLKCREVKPRFGKKDSVVVINK